MTFEFIIVHLPQEDESIRGILRERLRLCLVDNLNDVEEEDLARMIWLNFERNRPATTDGATSAVLGFSLELPDETASIREVVDDFADALLAEPILHALKCEDPLLRAELAGRAEELFALEMKLRRVLSIIYLHADRKGDPYDLLTDESVQPMSKERPQAAQMKAAAENQFFHLTFGNYVALNQRPAIKDLGAIIRNEATYEAFRAELLRQPVQHEDDAVFLASLKERMDAVEKMRNCVAHNRRPSGKVNEAYLNARPLVEKALDDYLQAIAADWRDSLDDGEMPWDTAARKAVEWAMESADWDKEAQTIRIRDLDDPRISKSVCTRDELVSHLEDVASSAFYANCIKDDDGDWISKCDENGVVEDVLADYDQQLTEFFAERGNDDQKDDADVGPRPPESPRN